MGLREKQSDERKRRILNVADALIRQTGGTEFSMRMLAEMSEVSPATPYNLFGSKDGVLSASLARSLSMLVVEGLAVRSAQPLDFVISANEVAVNRLVAEKELLRPLYLYLLGVVDPLHRPLHIKSSLYFWRTVAETAGGNGLGLVECDMLSTMLFAHFLGLLELWIHQDIDDESFKARAVQGSLLIVSPFIPADQQGALQERLASARLAFEKVLRQKPKKPRKPVSPETDQQ